MAVTQTTAPSQISVPLAITTTQAIYNLLCLLLIATIAVGIYYYWEYRKQANLRKHGIKVAGTIIRNKESSPNSKYRLGGNINYPTIKFVAVDGVEVIGKPIIGFTSQHEVVVPSQVFVVYEKSDPRKVCVV